VSTEERSNKIQTKDYIFFIIANVATLGNLLSGLYGIFLTLDNNVTEAFRYLLLGAFFDLIDGKLAKKSQIKSQFGEYADSFADLMTFALLPGFMVLALNRSLWLGDITLLIKDLTLGQLFAGVYAVGGWYRLIRFSAKPTGQKFEGLPSAAAAMFIGSFTVIVADPNFLGLPLNVLLTLAIILAGLLMGSTISYPSPKRMFQSDNMLITVAAIIGFIYLVYPNWISALMVLFISLLYTSAGPYYFIKTQQAINGKFS
jgi:CDP-diacylglycerol--serine O-phosphatidyltransferase